MTYSSLLIIIIVFLFFSDISREPCNNWHYLGHVKHIDDDDDDDDDEEEEEEDDDDNDDLVPSVLCCTVLTLAGPQKSHIRERE